MKKWSQRQQVINGIDFINRASRALEFAAIESHYFVNKGFFETDSWILDNTDAIKHIPTVIVQGRYDVVCPMATAWALSKKLPDAEFNIVYNSGHSASEEGTSALLVEAADKFSSL
jgi:proline iminopeptidase